jgi:Xaa-Pro dipeptidase
MIPWMWGIEGDKTCGISDTIEITEDGCRSFFSMDRDFTVKSGVAVPQEKKAIELPSSVPVKESSTMPVKEEAKKTKSNTKQAEKAAS